MTLREFAQRLVADEAYQAQVKARAILGELPPDLETFLWEVADGRLPVPMPNQSRTFAVVRPFEEVNRD